MERKTDIPTTSPKSHDQDDNDKEGGSGNKVTHTHNNSNPAGVGDATRAEVQVSDQSNLKPSTTTTTVSAKSDSSGGGESACLTNEPTPNPTQHPSQPINSKEIDPLSESTTNNVIDNDINSSSEGVLGLGGNNGNSNGTIIISSKPPVPNFRVEGSGSGDSSVTVAAVSGALSSTVVVSACIGASGSLHSSGAGTGHCNNSTGGTNSLENGVDVGNSSSGPVSIQSSEEMRLSLVSWYSEPDDPSRLIEGCCEVLSGYRKEVEVDVDDLKVEMGPQEMDSMSVSVNGGGGTSDSPACKSESEEKENKTPEPDKISISKVVSDKADLMISPKSKTIQDSKGSKVTNQIGCGGGTHQSSISKHEKTTTTISSSAKGSSSGAGADAKHGGRHTISSSHKSKVQLPDKRSESIGAGACKSSSAGAGDGGTHRSRCGGTTPSSSSSSGRPECPRCSRRSKSGTTTPASGTQVPRQTKCPASRRVVQSCKSSNEIKKPIKSILKHDNSRGSASGSDNNKSSMDSLGSSGDIGSSGGNSNNNRDRGRLPSSGLMTRSDSGARARFNFNTTPTTTCGHHQPEDKTVSKLKRIEKYATLRVRKNVKPKPLNLSDCEGNDTSSSRPSTSSKVGVPGPPTDLMSKSMSYLEKSSNRVHISPSTSTTPHGHHSHHHHYGESSSASSTLKRSGSLRQKKQTPPQWEPSGNRTTLLRLQKMHEAKAKTGQGHHNNIYSAGTNSNSSASANSGSGDSLHFLPPNSSFLSNSGNSSNSTAQHHQVSSQSAKEKHLGSKIFTKLSSALGQTASSNQKRLKQERGVQTETSTAILVNYDLGRVSVSPVPVPQLENPQVGVQEYPGSQEQIKNLERLCQRYKSQFQKVQIDYEKSEERKIELQKLLEETQMESSEMIDFLQAEKSTLAESLTEVEVEAQKWKDEMETLKSEYQSRCSSLVRLSEQHKQEALKSQALLNRMENQSSTAISQISQKLMEGTQSIYLTKMRVINLTESLLKTYKVPQELLNSFEVNQTIKETDLSCSLLLPLITSLSSAFPIVPIPETNHYQSSSSSSVAMTNSNEMKNEPKISPISTQQQQQTQQEDSKYLTENSSFLSLNQAILEREAAEKSSGLDEIMTPFSSSEAEGLLQDQDLKKEIAELNNAIAKLLNVVRVIVIHCDRKVSSVASSILQCLKSIEDDKGGQSMADLAQVQKSLEAWSNEKGISSENENNFSEMSSTSTSGTSNSNSSKITLVSVPSEVTSTSTSTSPPTLMGTTGENSSTPPKCMVGNGHARV